MQTLAYAFIHIRIQFQLNIIWDLVKGRSFIDNESLSEQDHSSQSLLKSCIINVMNGKRKY